MQIGLSILHSLGGRKGTKENLGKRLKIIQLICDEFRT